MLTRKHFLCYAYNDIDIDDGSITGAITVEHLSDNALENSMFLGVIGEFACERSTEFENRYEQRKNKQHP